MIQALQAPAAGSPEGTWRMSQDDVDACRSSASASSASCARTSATCSASIGSTTGSSDRALVRGRAGDAPARHREAGGRPEARARLGRATSRNAAPRSAGGHPSPTTRSFRSRSGWSISSTTRSQAVPHPAPLEGSAEPSAGDARRLAMEFALKTLSPDALPRALEKAVRYRLLNDRARPPASASTCWLPTPTTRTPPPRCCWR